MTARPWPEGTRPTAIQLLGWLRDQHTDTDEALIAVAGLLEATETAHRCLVMDHAGAARNVHHHATRVIELTIEAERLRTLGHRYRHAWMSARRRAADPDHAADVLEARALKDAIDYCPDVSCYAPAGTDHTCPEPPF